VATLVIIGGGIAGLSSALLLARDGHQVTVLERDPAEPTPADDAWDDWQRRGVNQFRLPHYFLARFRQLLDAELPDVAAALVAGGALRTNQLAEIPAEMTGGLRPGDERFEQITGRRPMVEAVFADIVGAEHAVTVRRATAVRALLVADRNGAVPHVTGVVTDAGEQLSADLVVDASGRRSSLRDLLAAAGCRPPVDDSADCGFVYYGRHFRSADGSVPPLMSPPNQPYNSLSILTLPADNGHWSVTLTASAKDVAMRRVKDPDVWTRVVRGYPLVAHLIDAEPITGVDVMGKIEDRVRNFVVDGVPVATGVVAVGDSWACTNPSIGRGASLALLHATCLRDMLRDVDTADAAELAQRWWAVTADVVEPWITDTLAYDHHRLAEVDADIAGEPYETDDPAWQLGEGLRRCALTHPDLLRGFLDIAMVLERGVDVLGRPGIVDTLLATPPPPDPPGPDRAQLLELLG